MDSLAVINVERAPAMTIESFYTVWIDNRNVWAALKKK